MAKKFVCTPDEPVVQTAQGKLRGFVLDGTYTFYGIPYAQADRFQAPRPVTPWQGVRDALSYGYVCPLMEQDVPDKEVLVPHRYWPMDEHCQNLNLWTRSLDPAAKRPVMVWLHGGGFSAGSAIEHVAYEGDRLCEFGDVVVVSVNHRLNLLGYLDLSAFGEKYANSGNAGNADLVAALEWIRQNIAAFGGDPDNVTLFGQSGGGEKVLTLMNTPAADGLFHKGIIESGVTDLSAGPAADGAPLVRAMLAWLGLDEKEADRLETLPYPRLVKAYKAVVADVAAAGGYIGCWPLANGWYAGNPRQVGFTEHAKTIPVLIGTVMGEFCFEPGVQNKYGMDEAQVLGLLREKYGAHTDRLKELFRAAYPQKHLSDLLYLDAFFRAPTRQFIALRSETCTAPTYSYLFSYDFPIDGGKVAWHCSEIPFVFHNTARTPLFNVPGETDLLEERVCGAFVNFARYGEPQVCSLPAWPACAPGDERTMILDAVCELRHNFDAALIEALKESGAAPDMTLLEVVAPGADTVTVRH